MHRQNQREKRIQERKNPPEEHPEFQIAPMVDILLVLLVFFMSISSTEILQPSKQVRLAVAADGRTAKKNAGQIIVNVTWANINDLGAIEVNNAAYPEPESILPVLQESIQANPVIRVLIRADRSVKWEYMRSVLKVVAEAGISNVTFAVVDKDSPQK